MRKLTAIDKKVEKQRRRAEMTIEERRKRRLALRRANGQRPRVVSIHDCREHMDCTVYIDHD